MNECNLWLAIGLIFFGIIGLSYILYCKEKQLPVSSEKAFFCRLMKGDFGSAPYEYRPSSKENSKRPRMLKGLLLNLVQDVQDVQHSKVLNTQEENNVLANFDISSYRVNSEKKLDKQDNSDCESKSAEALIYIGGLPDCKASLEQLNVRFGEDLIQKMFKDGLLSHIESGFAGLHSGGIL